MVFENQIRGHVANRVKLHPINHRTLSGYGCLVDPGGSGDHIGLNQPDI